MQSHGESVCQALPRTALHLSFFTLIHSYLYFSLVSFLHFLVNFLSYRPFHFFLVCMAYNVWRPRSSVKPRVICFLEQCDGKKKGCLISYNLTTTPKTHVGNGSHGGRMNERYSRTASTTVFFGMDGVHSAGSLVGIRRRKNILVNTLSGRLRKAMTRIPRFFPCYFSSLVYGTRRGSTPFYMGV